MERVTAGAIAAALGSTLEGDGERAITGVATLESAQPHELSFVANAKYLPYLQRSRAGAVLIPEALAASVPAGIARIVVEDPHIAMYEALRLLYPRPRARGEIHPTAVVDASAALGDAVSVGAYAVIGARARVGSGTTIGAHVVIGDDCEIGEACTLHAHATLHDGVTLGARCLIHSGARLGREGFGFVWHEGAHRRVPQVGRCILGDDVEIGANSTVDRGSIGDTVVGSGTKIDNLVHLGHNVRVGRHVIIIAQVGVSGSTTIGDGAVIGGQAGVIGHADIGAGARIGGQAGVIGDVPAGATYSGYPARPHREALRGQGMVARLPELMRRVRDLEQALSRAESSGPDDQGS
jgi:UDP-3-O-[3-hydroxymyristoyl] glucosamine N-acyltransferase